MGVAAVGAQAAGGGKITINGEIVDATCTVTGEGGAADFAVNLPKVSKADLAAKDDVAGATPFTLTLTNCPTGKMVYPFFQFGSNTLANGHLKNATGTATNVDVQLLDTAGTAIDVSKTSGAQGATPMATDATGAVNLVYGARYIATGAATSGTVVTDVTYTMTYQ
ncbi:fimbrial protein [Silvimonas amylolytica]|uniref:Fimbrial protein n=2 Tax=Silvimonas amylolytica TaxID=449663 RepID=A0ABQ2PIN6_9NEIS|nr:fimbrial protein [Silvimonas amylolytica]